MYNSNFFSQIESGSKGSAKILVPLVLNRIKPKSVIEFGCGHGNWAVEFLRNASLTYIGVDGGDISLQEIQFDKTMFIPADLNKPFFIGKYDLAVCLETAEHLLPISSKILVETLTKSSDTILFSAGLPGQGGTGHINERWLSFWVDLFASYGFFIEDTIRKEIWDLEKVEYWYRQNMVIFKKMNKPISFSPIDIVHPETFRAALSRIAYLENNKFYRLILKIRQTLFFIRHKLVRNLRKASW